MPFLLHLKESNKVFYFERWCIMILYHITYRELLEKIRKEGLRPKVLEMYSKIPYVYFDYDFESGCDPTLFGGAEDDKDKLVLIVVNSKLLDSKKLAAEPYTLIEMYDESSLVVYRDNIDPQLLEIYNFRTKETLKLSKVTNITDDFLISSKGE